MVSTGATIDTLRELVERASHENPHLTSRLEKAAFLVVLRQIEICGPNHYRVGSEDGLRDYVVINGHCDCHDYVRHGAGHSCKHRLALSLYRSLYGDESIRIEPLIVKVLPESDTGSDPKRYRSLSRDRTTHDPDTTPATASGHST